MSIKGMVWRGTSCTGKTGTSALSTCERGKSVAMQHLFTGATAMHNAPAAVNTAFPPEQDIL